MRDSLNYPIKRPHSTEELLSYTHLVLAHFTTSLFLDSIRQRGLIPDPKKERSIDDGVPSDHVSIYLSTHYERFYLQRAIQYHGGEGIIVVVQVARTAVAPDESALSEIERTIHPIDTQLFLSLCFGACKHPGAITLDKIIGIYDYYGKPVG